MSDLDLDAIATPREPRKWSEDDEYWYTLGGPDRAFCLRCHRRMKIGEPFWLDAARMICEPTPPFHDKCPE